jgi:hypothetical protein
MLINREMAQRISRENKHGETITGRKKEKTKERKIYRSIVIENNEQ